MRGRGRGAGELCRHGPGAGEADEFGVQDTEKGKVLQSVASVIQAVDPVEGIAPVEVRTAVVKGRVTPPLTRSSGSSHAACQQSNVRS